MLHGDGKHTRRYLFAGDATDALDTILHKGDIGQIYNIGSADEVSNLSLCGRLLAHFGLPHETVEDVYKNVQHTRDRPFNDRRYAVDGTKLKSLGWTQKISFEEGLVITVEWYKKYGEVWWGDVSPVFAPFPLKGDGLVARAKRKILSQALGTADSNANSTSDLATNERSVADLPPDAEAEIKMQA